MEDDFELDDAILKMMSAYEKPPQKPQQPSAPAQPFASFMRPVGDSHATDSAPPEPPTEDTAIDLNIGAAAAAARAQIRSGHARDFLAGGRAAVQSRTGSTFSPVPTARTRTLEFERPHGASSGLEAGTWTCIRSDVWFRCIRLACARARVLIVCISTGLCEILRC